MSGFGSQTCCWCQMTCNRKKKKRYGSVLVAGRTLKESTDGGIYSSVMWPKSNPHFFTTVPFLSRVFVYWCLYILFPEVISLRFQLCLVFVCFLCSYILKSIFHVCFYVLVCFHVLVPLFSYNFLPLALSMLHFESYTMFVAFLSLKNCHLALVSFILLFKLFNMFAFVWQQSLPLYTTVALGRYQWYILTCGVLHNAVMLRKFHSEGDKDIMCWFMK